MSQSPKQLGTGQHPFPQQKRTQELLDEDAFMTLHAGFGARIIYAVVTLFSWRPKTARPAQRRAERAVQKHLG